MTRSATSGASGCSRGSSWFATPRPRNPTPTWGVRLLPAPPTRDPAPALTGAVANGMRTRGVLVGPTGRAGNVLKVRPPLAFGDEHIVLVAEALEATLKGLPRPTR